jgi:hypothetical protein
VPSPLSVCTKVSFQPLLCTCKEVFRNQELQSPYDLTERICDVLIWDPKGKVKELFQRQFHCPKCNDLRPYRRKRVSKDYAFYFIPLFETKNLGECVECQVCKSGFDPKILKPSNQSLLKLVGTKRYERLYSNSPEDLTSRLISEGPKENLLTS